jgi:hypothetical protein
VPETIIMRVSASSSSLRSSRPASAHDRLVTRANAPETAIAWPAWPSLTCRSAAIGVSRLTGMNSEATSANAPSASAKTAPQAAGCFPPGLVGGGNRISMPASLSRQRRAVDHEAVLHVALEHALVGFVDLVGADHLDVGDDAVFGAEVEHLLGLGIPPIIEPASARRFMIRLNTCGDGCGEAGAPTSTMVPSRFSSVRKASRSCGAPPC